ncbi:MAG: lytic transglycosylase domain-containing protein [Brevefilum sp.]
MRRIIIIPAVVIGCMIVIWIGTVAAAQMPPQAQLAPTLTASVALQAQNETQQIHHPAEPAQGQTCSLPSSYPPAILQWCPAIEANAHEMGLPASLIAAVMLQESGGDPQAYSSSGAVGLMQVMPRDGLAAEFMCINGPCFAGRPTMAELEDPHFNIAYGTRMLAGLTARYGTYREALFRYGPMDVGYTYADLVIKIWENYQ